MTFNLRPKIGIVGTGLASGLLAEELGKWADVTVFERGRAFAIKPPRPIIVRHPLGLHPSFGYGLGGTTNLWAGGLVAMHPDEYGRHWPDDVREHLEPYCADVVRRLYGEEWLRIWKTLRAANERWPLLLDVMIKPHKPFRVRESACFARSNLKLAHQVQRVEEVGDKVILFVDDSGSEEQFVFDLAVISAGGMNSPLILRRSNIGGENVGKNITDHPMGFIAKVTRGPDHSTVNRLLLPHPQTEPMLKIRDAKSALWSAFYLRPTASAEFISDPYADSFMTLGSVGRLRKYFSALSKFGKSEFRTLAIAHLLKQPYFDHGLHAYVLVVSEQEARGQGSIREDASGAINVDWCVSDAVVSAIDRSLDKLADWLGAKLHRAPGDMRRRLWSAAHHSGGCRIGDDLKAGVVDSDLRVHGTERTFVCDGSVLPSTGASNTGLTIGALALRLAAHLARRSEQAPQPATRRTVPTVLTPDPKLLG